MALVTAAGLSACDGGSDPTVSRSAAPKTGSTDINTQPRSALKTGGTLNLSIQQWITQYNVGQVDGTQGDGQAILAMTQPRLWYFDESAKPSPNPDVLASASVTGTNPQVVTYKLNPAATWSDKTPITWQDFATQWKTRNGTDKRFQLSSSTGYDVITGVTRGADDREAKVTFREPYADWQQLFDPLLPGEALDTPEEFNTGWIEKIPVWGGPWKIGTADKTAQSITVVPNPDYWGTKPVLDSIVFRSLDSAAITDAYLNNEIDQAPGRQPDDYKRLASAPATTIRTGGRWDVTVLNLGSAGPLADVKVRQAIGAAIDRDAIAKAQSSGLPFAVHTVGNHFLMPSQDGYQDNSAEYAKLDLARAKSLLDQAGWTSSADGKSRTKSGQTLKLTYVVSASSTATFPQLIQNMLAQAGITVELRKVPGNDFFEKYVNRGSFDLVSFRNVDQLFPSMSYPVYLSTGEQNYGKIGSPAIDTLITQAAAETDHTKQLTELNQIDTQLWQEEHSLTLFQTPQILAVRDTLANFGAYGLRDDRQYTEVGYLK
ncbi:ABC transporter family substrate-binding protein [Winogradskya humida]|uniref:ABC transporter family substrate-binding protein n=1 Tax=Winogradskya humida TaxID=113566 RepID=UPI001EF21B3F|nr:ABC transporter family substrate-binding protein [Actinoplanes humidus]